MAQHYKLVLVIITAVLGGIWLGQSFDIKNKVGTSQPVIASSENIASQSSAFIQLQQQIHQLRDENHQLKKQLQINAIHSSSAQPANIEVAGADATAKKLTARLQTLEMEKQQRKATDVINWIVQSQNTNHNFDLNNELLARFEQENHDPVWAEQQESQYRQLFSNNKELQGIALRNTQCRSSQCEITIGISSTEQSNQLLQTMNKVLSDGDHPVAIMVATDERSGTSKFYISNNEDSLNFN